MDSLQHWVGKKPPSRCQTRTQTSQDSPVQKNRVITEMFQDGPMTQNKKLNLGDKKSKKTMTSLDLPQNDQINFLPLWLCEEGASPHPRQLPQESGETKGRQGKGLVGDQRLFYLSGLSLPPSTLFFLPMLSTPSCSALLPSTLSLVAMAPVPSPPWRLPPGGAP